MVGEDRERGMAHLGHYFENEMWNCIFIAILVGFDIKSSLQLFHLLFLVWVGNHTLKVRPHYAAWHTAAQRSKATLQKLITMDSNNAMRACVSTLQVTFLGDFFQFTKNVCVTKNSVISSPGTLH